MDHFFKQLIEGTDLKATLDGVFGGVEHNAAELFNNGLHSVTQPLRNIGEALGFGGRD